jgi:hypothetical protein
MESSNEVSFQVAVCQSEPEDRRCQRPNAREQPAGHEWKAKQAGDQVLSASVDLNRLR